MKSKDGFLSISGQASLNDDTAALKQWWSKSIDIWFEDGPKSSEATLVIVRANTAQYWSVDSKPALAIDFLKPLVTNENPDAGDSETVDL